MKTIKYLAFIIGAALLSCEDDPEVSEECMGPANTEVACYMIFVPVCGCEGVTYGNACIAAASGVKSFTEGKCK